jgi:uncharacterized protein
MKVQRITKQSELEEIIKNCQYCNMAMVDLEGKPYVLPFNYGYKDETIFLHSDQKGKKIDILEKNPDVCLSFSTDTELFFRDEHVACSYGMKYKSVLIYGKVEFVDDYDKKEEALNAIMKQYTEREFKYNAPAVKNVKVFKVKIEEITGKEFGNFI